MKRLTFSIFVCLLLACGAVAAQDKEKAPKKPKAEKAAPVDCSTVDDAMITNNVKAKLANTPSLKGMTINADTKAGVVTLTGQVKTGRNKGLATLQAKRVACVTKVNNQLTVEQTKEKTGGQ